ncbi:GNAT family N-acetyltransferase [Rhizobium sp. MHM7A]|uniref:GNAT family N-acetyltransferase n=1 Tax=Rhizobium sp. MHM7A TaxID=2583233 RepID=UPI001106FAE2|nr:GNAT family N-acetyltransferase [Rhizobium sp. MHM7A]TLX15922.1 hypothetical protein FFR93_00990 [Rhizobium sp. MHM7A]
MIEIKREHRNSHSGQHDFSLIATLDGEYAGALEYSVYQGEVAVQIVDVLEEKRRKGVGTALVVALQEAYPEQVIQFGMSTAAGAALLNSLEWRIEVNEAVVMAARDVATLTQKLRAYERRAEEILKLKPSERGAALEALSDWNQITDRVEELERIMNTQPAEFRYIVIPEEKVPTFGI